MHDPLDGAFLLEMPDSYPGETAVDLQPLNQDRLRDELEGRDFFQDTVVDGFVEDNSMDCLVLNLSLGPLLLLCGFSARGSRLSCAFGRLWAKIVRSCGDDIQSENSNPSPSPLGIDGRTAECDSRGVQVAWRATKRQDTHHIVGGMRPSARMGWTACVVFL